MNTGLSSSVALILSSPATVLMLTLGATRLCCTLRSKGLAASPALFCTLAMALVVAGRACASAAESAVAQVLLFTTAK